MSMVEKWRQNLTIYEYSRIWGKNAQNVTFQTYFLVALLEQ